MADQLVDIPIATLCLHMPPREREEMTRAHRIQQVLDDRWKPLAYQRMVHQVGTERAAHQGGPKSIDVSANLLRDQSVSWAVLYLQGAHPTHEDAAAAEAMASLLTRAQWLARMTQVQRRAVAMLDCPMRYEVRQTEGGYQLLLYPSSRAWVASWVQHPTDPSQPGEVWEQATDPATGSVQLRRWSATDVWLADLSGTEIEGTRKPHHQGDCPWLVWHLQPTHEIWNPIGESTYEATLNSATLSSFVDAAIRNAGWTQKWALDAEPAGVEVGEGDAGRTRTYVQSDPGRIMAFRRTEDGVQPQLGSFPQGVDPRSLSEAATAQHRRAALSTGGAGAAVYRQGGSSESAYALAITRDDQRRAQVHQAPLMSPTDVMLMERVALALATVTAVALGVEGLRPVLPLTGWGVRYHILPASKDEVLQIREMLSPPGGGPALITEAEAQMYLDPFLTVAEADARVALLREPKTDTEGGTTDG